MTDINSKNRPGFCPHCKKCIPFSSIVLHYETEEASMSLSGLEALLKRPHRKTKEEQTGSIPSIGKCPYCNGEVPVREVTILQSTTERTKG